MNRHSSSELSFVEATLWAIALSIIAVLAVPWFLWRSATIVAGLPIWLWWHIGWMLVASVVFYAFGRRAWGIGIEGTIRATSASDEVKP